MKGIAYRRIWDPTTGAQYAATFEEQPDGSWEGTLELPNPDRKFRIVEKKLDDCVISLTRAVQRSHM